MTVLSTNQPLSGKVEKYPLEIPFQDIVQATMEDTRHTRHRRARKYRHAKVLEIITTEGTVNLFALPFSKAGEWEKAPYDFTKHKKVHEKGKGIRS